MSAYVISKKSNTNRTGGPQQSHKKVIITSAQ